jgi:glucose/arabinose dehydrogenase
MLNYAQMMTRARFWLVIGFTVLSSAPAAAQFRAETIVRGLLNPVAVVADPTDASVLLMVEQRGVVRISRQGALSDEPFLDLRNDVRSGGEQGLLGIALAPDYADSRRFFVKFTNRDGNTVVARFLRDAENPLRADPASRFDLVWPDGRRFVFQPFTNHNGGHLLFGPDRYLYIGMGDGGSGGDPMNNAQNPQSLLGKMLRLDVGVPDDDPRGYRVPEDNPFVDGNPVRALPEIWAFGLRNPWRYAFDDWTRGGTSALLIGDVGQNAREEINFEPAGRGGRNYGWRLREGRLAYDQRLPAAFGPLVEPIHDYPRSVGASITGGLVYRGQALDPVYNGRYFYADYVSGRVFSIGLHLHSDTSDASADDEREHTAQLGGRTTLGSVSSFGQDQSGELLMLNYAAGTVVRVVPDFDVVPAAPEVSATQHADILTLQWEAPAGGAAAFTYFVERVHEGGVVSRLSVERREATVEAGQEGCFQVRAVARNGSAGPPSRAFCAVAP